MLPCGWFCTAMPGSDKTRHHLGRAWADRSAQGPSGDAHAFIDPMLSSCKKKHSSRLPRESGLRPPLEDFKIQSNKALSNLRCSHSWSCLEQKSALETCRGSLPQELTYNPVMYACAHPPSIGLGNLPSSGMKLHLRENLPALELVFKDHLF